MSLQSITARSLIYQAWRDNGALFVGQTVPPDAENDCFNSLNQLIDSWLIDRLMVFAIEPKIFLLTSALDYTIGPSGADFTADRPTGIDAANFIFTNTNPVVRKGLAIINDQQFATIKVRNLQNVIPYSLWYESNLNSTLGYGTIHLWPGPTAGTQLELFLWKQLQAFPDLTTSVLFAPAYARALRWNLAAEVMTTAALSLRPRENRRDTAELILRNARVSKAELQNYNAPASWVQNDPAFSQNATGANGDFNYLTGGFGNTW